MAEAKYTDEQKQEALDLYVEHGPAEAGRRLGIPGPTIATWARVAGVQTDVAQNLAAAVEASRLTREAKRDRLADKLLDKVLDLVDEMDGQTVYVTKEGTRVQVPMSPSNKKDLATAAAIFIDKFRLELGETTNRSEVVTPDQFAAYLLGAREAFDQQNSEP